MARHIRGTGRVFRRARSPFWWIAYFHRNKEIRESTRLAATVENRPKAEKMLRERTRHAGTPQFTPPSEYRVTFDDLAAAYLRDYRTSGRRSIKDAERIVKQLRETFGHYMALDITTTRIEAYTDARRAAGKASATINRELSALRRMFTLAVRSKDRDKRLTARPYIKMLDESDNIREGFLEPEDFAALQTRLPGDLADAATFAYHSAWRRGEVFKLDWRDVYLERRGGEIIGGTIRLPGSRSKNKKGRLLVLRADLLDVIRRRAAVRRLDCPLVFHRDGAPIRDFRTTWQRACTESGVGTLLFHDLRRSAIRNMVRAEVPETVAMKISGHKTRSVFDRYDIANERDISEAIEATAADVARKRSRERAVEPLRTENAGTTRTPKAV